ncbi:MAG: flagellar hook-length control protein FliK [Candidatus Velthaea sp.]
MNNVILDLIPAGGKTPADGTAGGATTKAATAVDAGLFRTALAGSVRSAKAAATPAQTTFVPADTATLQALQTKISKLLVGGAPQADVIAALAAQLASSVAQTVQTPGADARSTLQTLFATALAPPGRGDPASAPAGERALSLAQRFTRLANLANAIAGQPSGQQKRIAGNVLDAQRAKDIPARTTTSDDALAANAVAQSGVMPIPVAPNSTPSRVGPATAAAAHGSRSSASVPVFAAAATAASSSAATSPAVFATAAEGAFASVTLPAATGAAGGDGRRVNIGSRAAVSTGGDTGLGRILTRAVLAADARAAAAAPSVEPAAPAANTAPAPAAAALTAQRAASTFPAADPSAPNAALNAEGSPAPSLQATPANSALAAFVRAFEAALEADGSATPARPGQRDGQAAAAPAPAHALADNQAAAVVPVASRPIEPAAAAAATTAPSAPAPVDHSAIADQVLRGAFLRTTGGTSEIRLSLVPEALGDVSVKLVVTAGSVAAHVVADTPEAHDALVAAQPQLTKSLAEAGLKLASFSVDLSGGGFAGFSQQQNQQSQTQSGPRRASATADGDNETDETALAAIPSFGPSVPAATGAADFNYLA